MTDEERKLHDDLSRRLRNHARTPNGARGIKVEIDSALRNIYPKDTPDYNLEIRKDGTIYVHILSKINQVEIKFEV